MFDAAKMMYLYVETPLHAGTGRAIGVVDLPIQRERVTGYPMVQSSSIKGQLRALADCRVRANSPLELSEFLAVFGPDTQNAADHAGALSVGDAKLLLFPVRSLSGVFAWTTSVEVLARFQRDLLMLQPSANLWALPPDPCNKALVTSACQVKAAGNKVVLEEFVFEADDAHRKVVDEIAEWLAKNALPQSPEYEYWRAALPRQLLILGNDTFRDFTQFATEVQTHIRLNPETKTVKTGALWTEENLPADTLLYAPLCATPSRNSVKLTASQILDKIAALNVERMQLGGDETTGRGMVRVRMQ